MLSFTIFNTKVITATSSVKPIMGSTLSGIKSKGNTKIWDLFLGEEFLEEDRAGSEESGGYGIASCLHAVLYVAG